MNNAKRTEDLFQKTYSENYEKIKKYLMRKVDNHYIAEDLTSTSFEKALKNIKSFQWQGVSLSAWIYKIANNTLIDYYRKNSNKPTLEINENLITDKSKDIEESVTDYDSASRIKDLLAKLDDREKEIVSLKFYEGYTNKEIAKKLNLSETNISTILYRAIEKLRKMPSFKSYI